jgi:hypothetical protein
VRISPAIRFEYSVGKALRVSADTRPIASYDRLVQVVGGLIAAHLLRHPFCIADTGRITVHQ